ncbi:hypothetical protein CIK99_01170 [Prevotella sp. P5-92]|nr:hypothetical protein CIK99_01170 [Prevotella sp. P5-92]
MLMVQTLTEEQINLLKNTTMKTGANVWDYIQEQSEDDRPWVIAGTLSLMKKGCGLSKLEINWEARNIRYAEK